MKPKQIQSIWAGFRLFVFIDPIFADREGAGTEFAMEKEEVKWEPFW